MTNVSHIMLAEIGDKVTPIYAYWFFGIVASCIICVLTAAWWRAGLVLTLLVLLCAGFFVWASIWGDPELCEGIVHELGMGPSRQ